MQSAGAGAPATARSGTVAASSLPHGKDAGRCTTPGRSVGRAATPRADPSRLSSTVWRAATRSEPGYSSLPHRVRVSRTCAARSDRASNPVEKTAIAGWRASAQDRGHGCAQSQPAHTAQPHLELPAGLKRSPDTATADEVRRFELHLIESGESICNRNRVMTGVRFLFRVTLRRHDLAAEVWHLKEPQKLPPVLSPEEVKRVLTMATSLKAVLRYPAVDR
jgi:hypothetical protein